MTTEAPHDTRSRILDAALVLFSEHGFAGATLQQIADHLGFTKAALYYHFKSKDDILEALVAPAMNEMDALLDRFHEQPDTPGRRRQFIKAYLDYLLGHRRVMSYLSRDLVTVGHPVVARGSTERRARITAILAGPDLSFAEQVRVTLAVSGIGAVIATYPDADADELRAALIDALKALLRVRPHRRAAPVQRTPTGGAA